MQRLLWGWRPPRYPLCCGSEPWRGSNHGWRQWRRSCAGPAASTGARARSVYPSGGLSDHTGQERTPGGAQARHPTAIPDAGTSSGLDGSSPARANEALLPSSSSDRKLRCWPHATDCPPLVPAQHLPLRRCDHLAVPIYTSLSASGGVECLVSERGSRTSQRRRQINQRI